MAHEDETRKPFWVRVLHLPIQGGRELMWTAMGAYAIPSMEIYGIKADIGATVFSLSSGVTILTSLLIGAVSDKIIWSVGRRRPFIVLCTIFVIIGSILQVAAKWEGPTQAGGGLLYASFFIHDASLWTLQVPLYSYLMESFKGKDQAQILLWSGFVAGFGGIVGYLLCGWMPITKDGVVQFDIFYISVGSYLIGVIMNIFSVKEEVHRRSEEDETKSSVLSIFTNAPKKVLKLCLFLFFVTVMVVPHYIFFTTCYAESLFDAHREVINETYTFNNTEEAEEFFKQQLTSGAMEASKVFILFPMSVMIFSTLLEKLEVFRKIGLRNALLTMMIFFNVVLGLLLFFKTKLGFGLLAVALGYAMCHQIAIPYMLLDVYRSEPDYPLTRDLANDNALISATFSFGQMVTTLVVSFLVNRVGYIGIIIPFTLVSAMFGTVVLLWVDFGDASKMKKVVKAADDNRNETVSA